MSVVAGSLLSEPFGLAEGFQQLVHGTDPTAGTNYTYTLDSRWVQRLISIRFLLTTDSNAANRIVTINYLDPSGSVYMTNGPTNFLPASQTNVVYQGNMYRDSSDFNSSGSDLSTTYFGVAPIFLHDTYAINITITNIQAADQISSVTMLWERFDSTPRDVYTGPHFAPVRRFG